MRAGAPDPVTEIVDSCIVYWLAAGLPRPQAESMARELRGHLEQAVAAGKSPRAVVGDDLALFAEEWRRAVWQPRPWYERWLHVAHVLACSTFIMLLPGIWRPAIQVEVGHLVQILWLAAGVSVLVSPRFGGRWLANSEDRRQARRWIAVFLVTFAGLFALDPALPVVPNWGLWTMPRWQALLVAGVCLAVSAVAIALDPTRPRRRAAPR